MDIFVGYLSEMTSTRLNDAENGWSFASWTEIIRCTVFGFSFVTLSVHIFIHVLSNEYLTYILGCPHTCPQTLLKFILILPRCFYHYRNVACKRPRGVYSYSWISWSFEEKLNITKRKNGRGAFAQRGALACDVTVIGPCSSFIWIISFRLYLQYLCAKATYKHRI